MIFVSIINPVSNNLHKFKLLFHHKCICQYLTWHLNRYHMKNEENADCRFTFYQQNRNSEMCDVTLDTKHENSQFWISEALYIVTDLY